MIDMDHLATTYDHGRLVPFIGAGMSVPAAVNWHGFVSALARTANLDAVPVDAKPPQLVNAADKAVTALRCSSDPAGFATHLQRTVYAGETSLPAIPAQTKALAQLYWPLLCTTNYDDIYLRAKYTHSNGPFRPQVHGRSDESCRRVLEQQRFPVGEVVWALQGMLPPRSDSVGSDLCIPASLQDEIVIGHAEYRRVTHKEPWFRRAFADLFRRSSLLFLGTSLSDPYFLALFDEIVELTGRPARPHFAVVPDGVDVDRLRRDYGISCEAYPSGWESEVIDFLCRLQTRITARRARMTAWSYCVAAPNRVDNTKVNGEEDFAVVRAGLPDPCRFRRQPQSDSGQRCAPSERTPSCCDVCAPAPDVVAISCGNTVTKPEIHPDFRERFGPFKKEHACSNAVVRIARCDRPAIYGIVAREPGQGDLRSPKAVQDAFRDALEYFDGAGAGTLHVQLLAAGRGRAFHPWVSLVQMARAYGAYRKSARHGLKVRVYVVDPGVVLLLRGGNLDLAEHLDNAPLYVRYRVMLEGRALVDAHGLASGGTTVKDLIDEDAPMGDEQNRSNVRVELEPALKERSDGRPRTLEEVLDITLEELGVVSGGVLTLHYRYRTNP